MSDTVIAATIGVGGAVFVAVATVVTQLFITRNVIRAERQKLADQLRGEEISRMREKWRDRIIEALSDLLVASDPQSASGVDYGRTVNLIIRVQLLLDLKVARQRELNRALNQLGLELQEYVPVRQYPIDQKLTETNNLLKAHAAVVEHAKSVLSANPPPSNLTTDEL